MIKIIDEPAQVNAWITNGCDSCGSRDKEKNRDCPHSITIRWKRYDDKFV